MLTTQLVRNKRILIRADLDVPTKGGEVVEDYRLRCLLPTIKVCVENAQSTLIIGHKGRPTQINSEDSLFPVKSWLERAMGQSIYFIDSGFSPEKWVRGLSPITMLENIRFDKRELEINTQFAKDLASGSDIYIYEAFASYNPSTTLQKIPEILPTYTGIQFDLETEKLDKATKNIEHPSLLILSGAKSDKLELLPALKPKFDHLFLGGKLAKAEDFTSTGFDINQDAVNRLLNIVSQSKTVVFNGPLGKFEDQDNGQAATKQVLNALKNSGAFTLLGGGDTLSSINALGFKTEDFKFVSTGGGAMLEYLATGTHPLLEVLKKLNKKINI